MLKRAKPLGEQSQNPFPADVVTNYHSCLNDTLTNYCCFQIIELLGMADPNPMTPMSWMGGIFSLADVSTGWALDRIQGLGNSKYWSTPLNELPFWLTDSQDTFHAVVEIAFLLNQMIMSIKAVTGSISSLRGELTQGLRERLILMGNQVVTLTKAAVLQPPNGQYDGYILVAMCESLREGAEDVHTKMGNLVVHEETMRGMITKIKEAASRVSDGEMICVALLNYVFSKILEDTSGELAAHIAIIDRDRGELDSLVTDIRISVEKLGGGSNLNDLDAVTTHLNKLDDMRNEAAVKYSHRDASRIRRAERTSLRET